MNNLRKSQLNRKLRQFYDHGSGRTEYIEDLLKQEFLGHEYFITEIKVTVENPPCEEYDFEDKDYTFVEFSLMQEGNACIATFDVPVSNKILQDIAAKIDMAYYRWMQREPQGIRENDPFEYYQWLLDASLQRPMNEVDKQTFETMDEEEIENLLNLQEWDAFLPPSEKDEL